MILDLITTAFQNKWVRIAAIVIILGICAICIRKNIYDSGYNAGVAYQTQVNLQTQVKAKQQFDDLQAKADEDRSKLNKQITDLSDTNKTLREELAKKATKTKQEVTDYAKTSAGVMSCFAPNDSGLFIINNSFPASSDRTVQSSGNSTN